MQRIELRSDDEQTAPGSGAGAERRVTLVFPASVTEYEQARAEVETYPRPHGATKPDDHGGNEGVTPAGEDGGAVTAETPFRRLLRDDQRRAAAGVGPAGPGERGGRPRHRPA